jgi:arginyl-tRNA synthetase
MKEKIQEIIEHALLHSREQGLLSYEKMPSILFEAPKRKEFGDLATNVAMLLAEKTGNPPRTIAEIIKGAIKDSEGVIEKLDVAGPGFLNIFISQKYWHDLLKQVTLQGDDYGRSDLGKGEKAQVEFVSANPTGPLHIGHGRGAAVGDSIANILDYVGYDVTREYYINDVGKQMETLGLSVLRRYQELLGEKVEFPEEGYQGDYIRDLAAEIAEKEGRRYLESKGCEDVVFFSNFASKKIQEDIDRTLEEFNVRFDVWYSEKSLFDKGIVSQMINYLEEKELAYEREGALWFASTDFGDDKDRVLRRADGNTTYFASDIAYHNEKFERGFKKVVNIWGADHHGYQPRITAFLRAIGVEEEMLRIIFVQLVTLLRSGEKVAMSTRGGQFVTLADVIQEVGKDAARFFFLLRRTDSHLEFDLELAKKETAENPVFYVQYAHARICSIIALAKEKEISLPAFEDIDSRNLTLQEEIDIIKALVEFPEVVRNCALSYEPHHLTFYLQKLAGMFHSYYNKHKVVSDDEGLTRARLYLCLAIKVVLKNCLTLLGVSAPEKM